MQMEIGLGAGVRHAVHIPKSNNDGSREGSKAPHGRRLVYIVKNMLKPWMCI